MFKTALFDMDGVLLDSRPVMNLAWKAACEACNCDVPFSEYFLHVGKPFEQILQHLQIPTQIHYVMKQVYGSTAASSISSASIYKHVYRVLRSLRYAGFKIGIVTSKEFWRADQIVDLYRLNCDLLVTPEHTDHGKPSPEPIMFALKSLKSLSSEAFYVGDMASDLESASASGVYFIKANWGYGDFSYPGVTLDSPSELLDFLGNS